MTYQVTEPHPTVKSSTKPTYLGSGIGGAGNYKRYAPSHLTSGPSATGPASRTALPPPPSTIFSGRGGAGNAYKPAAAAAAVRPTLAATTSRSSSDSSPAIFSFDEELQREQRMRDNAARVYIGRGGAGNAVGASAGRKLSASSGSSVGSGSSSGGESRRRSMMERISRTLSRN